LLHVLNRRLIFGRETGKEQKKVHKSLSFSLFTQNIKYLKMSGSKPISLVSANAKDIDEAEVRITYKEPKKIKTRGF
jgi:hypothetical protein